ncbi:MAG: hypothetical protein AAGH64_00700 [Planctomycetota bacterium]
MKTPAPQLVATPRGLKGTAPVPRIPLVFTLFIGLLGIVFVAFPLGGALSSGAVGLGTIVLLPASIGLLLMLLALWLALGSRGVVVRDGALGLRYAFGPIGFTYRFARGLVERVRVSTAKKGEGASAFDAPYTLEARVARDGSSAVDTVTLAEGEEPAWMVEWCERIAEELGVPTTIARAARRALEPIDDATVRPPDRLTLDDPPAGCPSTVEVTAGHVTLYARADKASKQRTRSYLALGGVFIVFPLVVGYFLLNGAPLAMQIGVGSGILLVVAIGVAMVLYGSLSGADRWIFDVTGNQLVCTYRNLGRTKSVALHASRVRSVEVVHSGETIGGVRTRGGAHSGGVAVKQLRVDFDAGFPIRAMTGCSDASLEWCRDVLRAALVLD